MPDHIPEKSDVAGDVREHRDQSAQPRVSVAMATYNGARFILEQLDSIAAQTVPPAELVVTDDASSDDTVAIVKAFAEVAAFPVRIYENAVRLGYRHNFMRNVALCTSDIIALCDQDDVWYPDKLERMLAPFADADVVLAYHDAWLIDGHGKRIELARILPLEPKSPPSSLFPLRNPYGFSMLIRRELVSFSDLWPKSVDNLKTDTMMAHDQWFFFLACALGTVAFVDVPLAGYRQHDNNTYGVERPPRTIGEKIARWVNVRSKEYASFTIAARVRAAILRAGFDRFGPEWQARATLAIARYETLSRHCAWRAAIYDPGPAMPRLGAWHALLRDGAYSNRTRWSFGRKAMLADFGFLSAPAWLLRTIPAERGGLPKPIGTDATPSTDPAARP
ncbi:MAG: glycosyltransferase family 2 protein [Sphingomonas sp.]|nr:MAG: glycosyltransferase family 2 protein [Sphingomonas sp.]